MDQKQSLEQQHICWSYLTLPLYYNEWFYIFTSAILKNQIFKCIIMIST